LYMVPVDSTTGGTTFRTSDVPAGCVPYLVHRHVAWVRVGVEKTKAKHLGFRGKDL